MSEIRESGRKQAYIYYLYPVYQHSGIGGVAQNRVVTLPIEVPENCIVDAICIMNGNVNGNFRLGLYKDNGRTPDGGVLMVETGSVVMAGANMWQTVSITPTYLAKGMYWLAFNNDSATATHPTMNVLDATGLDVPFLKYDLAYAAFTNPCPAVAAASATETPYMLLRVLQVI